MVPLQPSTVHLVTTEVLVWLDPNCSRLDVLPTSPVPLSYTLQFPLQRKPYSFPSQLFAPLL